MIAFDFDSAPADKIAAFLGHGVNAGLVERIRGAPALRRHLTRLLASRFDSEAINNPAQAAAVGLTLDGVAALAQQAGIVWHAAAITTTIEAGARRALVEDLGEDLYALALAARASSVATPPPLALPPSPIGVGAQPDGAACVSAWCDAQPRRVADRLRLSWPDAVPNEMHRRYAPAMVDWLLVGRPTT